MRGSFFAWRICNEAVRGGVVAVRTPAGDLPPPDRRYHVAHPVHCKSSGKILVQVPSMPRAGCEKASELCTAHPRPLRLAIFPPKKNAQKSSPSHTNGSTYTENHPRKEFTYTMKAHKTITYEYKNAPIPGGGYVTGLLYHPKQPGILYARTDIGGVYRYEYEKKCWKSLIDSVSMADISETFPIACSTR